MELDKNICRSCTNTFRDQLHTFSTLDVKNLFVECTGIEILAGDPLPQQICNTCYEKCVSWKLFKQQSHEANQRLLRKAPFVDLTVDSEDETPARRSEPMVVLRRLTEDDTAVSNPNDDNSEGQECPICDKTFQNVQEHLLVHISKTNPHCPRCARKFARVPTAISHILSLACVSDEDESDAFSISSESDEMPKRIDRRRRRTIQGPCTQSPRKRSRKPLECSCCERRFNEANTLCRHILKSHGSIYPLDAIVTVRRDTNCPLCPTHISEDFERFKNHVFSDHVPLDMEKKIHCHKCSTTLESGRSLLDHLFRHTDGQLICKLPNCFFQTERPSQMEKHAEENHGVSVEMCPTCGKWETNMDKHNKDHQGNICCTCHGAYMTRAALKDHERTHFEEIPGRSNSI